MRAGIWLQSSGLEEGQRGGAVVYTRHQLADGATHYPRVELRLLLRPLTLAFSALLATTPGVHEAALQAGREARVVYIHVTAAFLGSHGSIPNTIVTTDEVLHSNSSI